MFWEQGAGNKSALDIFFILERMLVVYPELYLKIALKELFYGCAYSSEGLVFSLIVLRKWHLPFIVSTICFT